MQGFVYLVALLDWFSRYMLSWSLSTTLEAWFCVQALAYRTPAEVHFGAGPRKSNNVTGVNKKEKEAKRKKMLLRMALPWATPLWVWG